MYVPLFLSLGHILVIEEKEDEWGSMQLCCFWLKLRGYVIINTLIDVFI